MIRSFILVMLLLCTSTTTFSRTLAPYQAAETWIGVNEFYNSKRLSALFNKELGVQANPKQISWCALFVNSMLVQTGHKTSNNLFLARSFLDYGKATKLPEVGDIVVFKDLSGDNNSWAGHVGFFMGFDKNGWVITLGGNQDGVVKLKSYPASMVLSYRIIP